MRLINAGPTLAVESKGRRSTGEGLALLFAVEAEVAAAQGIREMHLQHVTLNPNDLLEDAQSAT
jgi:hypothetical protein